LGETGHVAAEARHEEVPPEIKDGRPNDQRASRRCYQLIAPYGWAIWSTPNLGSGCRDRDNHFLITYGLMLTKSQRRPAEGRYRRNLMTTGRTTSTRRLHHPFAIHEGAGLRLRAASAQARRHAVAS